jgi:hypothetical protein
MQRVYWTLDLLEAHIVADFLRAQGVDAQIFDADFVRQDWLASLAYGGFRVVAPDEECGVAKKLIADLSANAFALESDQIETPECPRCGAHDAVEDPMPRRIASVFLLFLKIPGVPFKWRYRCTTCGIRWKAPPERPFRELAVAANAAEPPA